MKKLIAVAAVLLSTAAVAQPDKDWWACQVVHTSGMDWVNNQWVTRTFDDSLAFVLMSDGNGSLTEESVAKVSQSRGAICVVYGATISCHDGYGSNLFFYPETGKGGISNLWGSVMSENKISVLARPFECTKG